MDYKLLADEVLLKFLKISDELAFEELYLRYWKSLYYSALNKIKSREIAEDIVQGIYTNLWEKREKHSIQNLSAYLETAVKYQVINYIKSAITKKTHLASVEEKQKAEESTTDITLLVRELNAAIDKAINQLPEKTQIIFRLSRFESRSNKDISRIMDLSEKAVEYHIRQSLHILRIHLKDFMVVDFLVLILLINF